MAIATALTKCLGIEKPIILGPMGGVSGGKLAAAVSRAGGLGLLGAGYDGPDWVEREFAAAEGTRVGIGFITWHLAQHPETLATALAHNPAAVMLSFGDATPFVKPIKDSGARLIMQIQSVADARKAVALGADVVVAQGTEGGGHGAARGSIALTPAVVDAAGGIPVAAAGGIADGRGLAAALALGAGGVLIGTRFYASDEALGKPQIKQHLVASAGDDTVRTAVFDIIRGIDWPAPYTGRAVRNSFTERWHRNEAALQEARGAEEAGFRKAVAEGDPETAIVWASEAIDMIDAVEPAGAIVRRIADEAEKILQRNAALLA